VGFFHEGELLKRPLLPGATTSRLEFLDGQGLVPCIGQSKFVGYLVAVHDPPIIVAFVVEIYNGACSCSDQWGTVNRMAKITAVTFRMTILLLLRPVVDAIMSRTKPE